VKWLVRFALAVVGFTGLLGLAAPYMNAGAFREPIQNALEDAFGRKVEVEKVHFTLFTGPGFTLENVDIDEDPRYGLEPFAHVPTLELRVRLDKLLLGQIRPLSLRLVDASLNLVKNDDGAWNAVTLVERLGAPRSAPFNFIPAVQISNGRIDFKLGTRKTTLYITDTDLSIYPESSGKIYFKFEGSPARTDRAGNGFGHLTGTANWYLRPMPATNNQLEADVSLQPSNLSELTTLLQGHDLGVHGTVSAHVLISGPLADLRALGDMQLQDVHRWDLLPSPGEALQVRFRANVDLNAHTLALVTIAASGRENPVTLQLRANDFMTRPTWSVLANLHKAPLASLLPLARRMGMGLPAGLQMDGALDGALGFSSSAGLEGGVVITNAVANVPNVPPLRSASANVTISGEKIHIDPAILQSESGGTLRAGGDFNLATQDMTADISADQFSIAAFKETTNAWFGSPDALALAQDGRLSGHFLVSYAAEASAQRPIQKPAWSGQVQFSDATIAIPGIAMPVKRMQGKANFDEITFDFPRLSGIIEQVPFTGSYHYSVGAKHPERLKLEFPEADLLQVEAALAPTLSDDSLLSRLPFTKRSMPEWLANRNMEGDLSIDHFSIQQTTVGSLSTHFTWQGTTVQLTNTQLGLSAGKVQGSGTVVLSARLPRYHFVMKVNGYPWGGGTLAANGNFESSGTGVLALQNLQGVGAFSGEDIAFSNSDPFSVVSGQFNVGFNGKMPLMKLTSVAARQNDEDWSGDGTTSPDGKLHLDLTNGDKQIHLVADLASGANQAPVTPSGLP
jgi:uncharacterized protein involved in outer membrane biogenesis